ncbi:hypothetical protein CDAR_200491 [Caerostris darwini]|uniref:Uncharacterized protein n=1 Tax=Caerostris darwini TaxID=1538125 RepID=A0AAV4MY18_9ARAC|nr:hypothetical protein CDAR_200491 [Caerostris darwini]
MHGGLLAPASNSDIAMSFVTGEELLHGTRFSCNFVTSTEEFSTQLKRICSSHCYLDFCAPFFFVLRKDAKKTRVSQEMRMKLLISERGGLLTPVSNSDIAMSFVTGRELFHGTRFSPVAL